MSPLDDIQIVWIGAAAEKKFCLGADIDGGTNIAVSLKKVISKKTNPALCVSILDYLTEKVEKLESDSFFQNRGQPRNVFQTSMVRGNPGVFCKVCNKSSFAPQTRGAMKKVKQRLLDHTQTARHTDQLLKHKANESDNLSVIEQIEKSAIEKGIQFLNSKQKESVRKEKLKNLLRETHYLQVTESANNLLVQLQIHDEYLKPGSTTLGSYIHGDDPALAVSALSVCM